MKQFVLDTNILIESPDAIWGFDDNVVCITQKTLEELDGLKKVPGDTGFNARRAIRNINSLNHHLLRKYYAKTGKNIKVFGKP